MIKPACHLIDECPVCGRPVKIRREYLGRRVVCQHCHGGFLVTESGPIERYLIRRCNRLLAMDNGIAQDRSRSLGIERSSPPWKAAVSDRGASLQRDRAILLVEHRDEVFAPLEAGMGRLGLRVIRTSTAWEAARRHQQYLYRMVVANLSLPDESGWLLTAKLRLFDPAVSIWLYTSNCSAKDTAMAEHIGVDELLEYRGGPAGLVDTITGRLIELGGGHSAAPPNAKEVNP